MFSHLFTQKSLVKADIISKLTHTYVHHNKPESYFNLFYLLSIVEARYIFLLRHNFNMLCKRLYSLYTQSLHRNKQYRNTLTIHFVFPLNNSLSSCYFNWTMDAGGYASRYVKYAPCSFLPIVRGRSFLVYHSFYYLNYSIIPYSVLL